MSALEQFEKKFIPLPALLMLLPLLPAWYLFILKEMSFPPLDLTVYRRAADYVVAGMSPYSDQFATGDFESLPWVYTPFASLLVAPLHYVPLSLLTLLWTVLAIVVPVLVLIAVSYAAILRTATYSRGEKIALFAIFALCALLVGAVLDTFALGQIGVLLAAFTLYDLGAPEQWFRRRWALPRGVLAGLAGAIKLVPLIAIPYWLITKQWRAAITAMATVALAWGSAALVFPKDSLTYFMDGKFLGTNSVAFIQLADNQSLIAAVQRAADVYPLPAHVWVPIAAAVAITGLLVARATYRNGSALSAGIIVGLTSALVSPVSWVHHFAWLVAVPGAILAGGAFRTDAGRVSKAGWAWLVVTLVLSFPPARYSWSPLAWIGWDEHYNLLSILFIAVLWHRSRADRRLVNA